ncbi:MAG: SPOR domain-containing protein [bacterium]
MKPKKSAPVQIEYEPKHRLAGAIIMVAAAVLVIPLILPEQAIESRIQRAATSESTSGAIVTTLSQSNSTGGDSSAASESKPALQRPEPAVVTAEPSQPAPTQLTPSKPAPKTPPTADSGWEVRVGTYYSEQADTGAMLKSLADNGFTAHQKKFKTSLGDQAIRIWLGPYADKKTADEVAAQLVAITNERGYVTEHAR